MQAPPHPVSSTWWFHYMPFLHVKFQILIHVKNTWTLNKLFTGFRSKSPLAKRQTHFFISRPPWQCFFCFYARKANWLKMLWYKIRPFPLCFNTYFLPDWMFCTLRRNYTLGSLYSVWTLYSIKGNVYSPQSLSVIKKTLVHFSMGGQIVLLSNDQKQTQNTLLSGSNSICKSNFSTRCQKLMPLWNALHFCLTFCLPKLEWCHVRRTPTWWRF